MAYIKYRGAKHVPVKVVGKVKRNGKVMGKVKTEKLCHIVRKDQ